MNKALLRFDNAQLISVERSESGQASKLTGYAAVFYRAGDTNTEYVLYDSPNTRVVERIGNTAFSEIASDDVRILYNHDDDKVLGRSSAGTLRLNVDTVGLRYENDLPETQWAKDLAISIARNDITGSSFAFYPKATQRTSETASDGKTTITYLVTRAKVKDVGPVTFPAYKGTSAGLRSEITELPDEILEDLKNFDIDKRSETIRMIQTALCRSFVFRNFR